MTAKIFVLTTDNPEPVHIGGTWWDHGDAASDINGGDFWDDVRKRFPDGVEIKEIRIVPDEPIESKEAE